MTADALVRKFELLTPVLDERTRRLVAAAEARALGFGGVTAVAQASGLSRGTVIRGIAELKTAPKPIRGQRVRRKGAGRKRTVDQDTTLKRDLETLVEPVTRGDPESPLRWTCKSVRQLAGELQRMGHQTSHRMVAELLHQMDYSLQANRKTLEGSWHPDRDAQFHHISDKTRQFQADHQPVISVDTKKKELVGDFKNNGRELRPKGDPEKVRVHDFLIPELGRAAPYGVYDNDAERRVGERGRRS
jgi:transposase